MKNTQGQQLPMGVTVQEDGVSFSVAAKKGKACCLLLYHAGEKEPCARYPMRQSEGAVYTVKVTDIQSGAYAYEYLMNGIRNLFRRFCAPEKVDNSRYSHRQE